MESVKKLRLGDKTIPIVIAIVAVVIVGIIAAVVHQKQDKVETQRTARTIEINGPCSVLREGATINAIIDMPLYSGDTFFSGVNASARIMVDDDKFLYLDAATRINFTATGTPDETHTMIYIETGSVSTEVKELLAEGESFDIVTPNTITTIHGTLPLFSVTKNWDGSVTTSIAFAEGEGTVTVFERNLSGAVSCTDINMSVHEGVSFTTAEDSLLTSQDVRSLSETGKTAGGKVAQNTTLDNLQTVSEEASFDNSFLENAQAAAQRNTQDYVTNHSLDSASATYQQENLATVHANDIIDEFKAGEGKIPVTVVEAQQLPSPESVSDSVPSTAPSPIPDPNPEPEPEPEPEPVTEPDPAPVTTAVNNNNDEDIIYVNGIPLNREQQIQAILEANKLVEERIQQMEADRLATQPPSQQPEQGGQSSEGNQTPQQPASGPSQSSDTTPSPSPSTSPSPSPSTSPSTSPSNSPSSSPSPTPDQTSDTHPTSDVTPSQSTSPSSDSSDNTESSYIPTGTSVRPGFNGSIDPIEPIGPAEPADPSSDPSDTPSYVPVIEDEEPDYSDLEIKSDEDGRSYVEIDGERYDVMITYPEKGPYIEIDGGRVYLDSGTYEPYYSPTPS